MNLDYDTLAALKKQHPTLRLLNADNLPLIIAFLYRVFVLPNQRSLAEGELQPPPATTVHDLPLVAQLGLPSIELGQQDRAATQARAAPGPSAIRAPV